MKEKRRKQLLRRWEYLYIPSVAGVIILSWNRFTRVEDNIVTAADVGMTEAASFLQAAAEMKASPAIIDITDIAKALNIRHQLGWAMDTSYHLG